MLDFCYLLGNKNRKVLSILIVFFFIFYVVFYYLLYNLYLKYL